MPRKRAVAIEETTTRRVTLTEEHTDDTEPIPWAPGWDTPPRMTGQRYREQRATQLDRCLQFLWAAVESGEMTAAATGDWSVFTHQLPGLIRSAEIILRAGPGATPLELTLGRSA